MKKSTTSTAEAHGNGNRSETSNVLNSKGTKHDANLRKNGFIHFQIGLILAMLMVYFGLEYAVDKMNPKIAVTNPDTTEILEFHADANNFKVEKEKVIQQTTEKKINPEKIKIVKDDVSLKPQLDFKPTEATDSEIITVGSINVAPIDRLGDDPIPFVALEDVPVFPGCENVAKSERKNCFQESMQRHIVKNFKYPEAAVEMRTEGKVYIIFTINKEGLIEDLRLRGPAKILEDEAARIIGKLPQMKPGMQRMQPVKVSFSQPINFQLH